MQLLIPSPDTFIILCDDNSVWRLAPSTWTGPEWREVIAGCATASMGEAE
jgi:hypothetical protein